MASINPVTHERIKAYLEVFIEGLVGHYKTLSLPELCAAQEYVAKTSPTGDLKPFHVAIIPESLLRINAFERGFSTRLGSTFEECGRLIAVDHHQDARRGYVTKNYVSRAAIEEIDRQVSRFEHVAQANGPKPSLDEMVDAVLSSVRADDLVELEATADLYVLARDGTEYFFEIKSPKPNKGQALEITQRILRFHLLRGKRRPEVQAYFAMGYNPYGSAHETYRWPYARNYMPFEQAVIIADEFWSVLGGPGAYHELISIYQEVGREKSKYMIDALAFGF